MRFFQSSNFRTEDIERDLYQVLLKHGLTFEGKNYLSRCSRTDKGVNLAPAYVPTLSDLMIIIIRYMHCAICCHLNYLMDSKEEIQRPQRQEGL